MREMHSLASFWLVKDAQGNRLQATQSTALGSSLKLRRSSNVASFPVVYWSVSSENWKQTQCGIFSLKEGQVTKQETSAVPSGRSSPAKVQLPEVHDLPSPALGGPCVVGAARVVLSGAQGADEAAAVEAERQQQVPGGSKVPGKFQSDRISRWAVRGAANVDLGMKESVMQIIWERHARTLAMLLGGQLTPDKGLTEICHSGRYVP